MTKVIQEQFGEKVITAFADFARTDLKTPDILETDEFSHVADTKLRRSLSQVHYGVRWIYKLGLALLAKNEERAAHVRAQIVDYASIAEGLLSDCITHALQKNIHMGESYKWWDPDKKRRPINWKSSIEYVLSKQSLYWLIRVAHEFKIVSYYLEKDLHWLREQRNTVHLRRRASLGQTAFLYQSKKAFDILNNTIRQTKVWKNTHR